MFPSRRVDQTINSIVDVFIARLDSLIAEVYRLLRVIPNLGDVSGGIVGIVQALQFAGPVCTVEAGGVSPCLEIDEAECVGVVAIGSCDTGAGEGGVGN